MLKGQLRTLCRSGGRAEALVRIACQELEAWYLGEPEALAEAFDNALLRSIGNRARYRDPDAVARPSAALAELEPAFQKVSGARRMALRLSRERNRSRSFQVFIAGIAREVLAMQSVSEGGEEG